MGLLVNTGFCIASADGAGGNSDRVGIGIGIGIGGGNDGNGISDIRAGITTLVYSVLYFSLSPLAEMLSSKVCISSICAA